MPKVLIVYHSQSGNTKATTEAVAEGVKLVVGTEAEIKEATKAGPEDLLSCDGIAIGGCQVQGQIPFNANQGKECIKLCVE